MTKPSLVIFDLDETLMSNEGKLYSNVKAMLETIKTRGMKIALASYNSNGETRLKENGIREYFDIVECEYWVSKDLIDYKKEMLSKILKETKAMPVDVMFFDDNTRNIKTAEEMGINAVYTEVGGVYKVVTEKLIL
jgi:HAD superfamily phosphatase (TIGR01681 family)